MTGRQRAGRARTGPFVGRAQEAVAVGRAHLAALRWHDAAQAFTRALEADSDCPGAARGLGDASAGAAMPALAASAYRMALRLEPDDPDLLNSLGAALFETGDLDGAAEAYSRALAVRPDHADALGNQGTLLKRQGALAEALACYDRALGLAPDSPELHYNRGNCLDRLGRFTEAAEAFDRALALRPGLVVAGWNRTLGLLSAGRLEEAWAGYERRVEIPGFTQPAVSFLAPRWQGEPRAGRTLLLHAEQGMGDTLQFARFVPGLAAEGPVVLRVQPPLVRLLSALPGVVAVVAEGEPLPPHDLHLPLLSLPWVLKTGLDTIPPPPRLRPPPPPKPTCGDLAVGLVWAGSPAHANDAARSMPLTALAGLFDLPGVRFHSLQVGPAALKVAHPALVDRAPALADFADTADVLQSLDLLISVDTSTAHLAGTLGIETLLLLPEHPDWRWMRARSDTPWYPSMRLLRQERPGEWAPVVAEARRLLIERLVARARHDPHPLTARGAALMAAGDLDGASRCFALLQQAQPDAVAPLVNYAAVLERRGDPASALVLLDHAAAREPASAAIHHNRGNCLDRLDRLDEAVGAFDRALALDPALSEARWNRTLSLLAAGRLPEAWAGHEERWHAPGCTSIAPDYRQPRWTGEDLRGRTLLLHAEQGLGDTLQFIRYAPLIAARGARVILRCQPALVRLLQGAPGLAAVVPFDAALPAFDCYLPLASAAQVFGTDLATIPPPLPLTAEPLDLGGAEALRVGLVWAGNSGHANDARRSAPLAALDGLLGLAGVRCFSLQVGPRALSAPHREIVDLAPRLTDLSVTARVLAAVDVVVTVDTAVAHLAGTLGRDTLVLLPPTPDWRWMRAATRTPWYPTLHLLRQPASEAATPPSARSWAEPVARARAALEALSRARRIDDRCIDDRRLQPSPQPLALELTRP